MSEMSIELHEDGYWKDITGEVARVSIHSGRAHERGGVQPTRATVILDNGPGFFATDVAAFKSTHRIERTLAIKVGVPAGPWQRLKARLRRVRGLGWLPVRMRWEMRFQGVVDPNLVKP